MTDTIYPNAPRVAVGALVVYQNKVLLVLRGKAPAKGVWAVPGGSVNIGETLQAAAEREVLEETGLQIKAGEVIYSFEKIQRDNAGQVKYHYVILDLEAEPLDPVQTLTPADDAVEAGWFTLADLDRLDLPVSETTRTLLQKKLSYN
ncbi:MAG: NUDIX hydrolase [Thermodesulfobacteriota bacterium]|nr:NUDIX hydrolase [Thermodesulfobacteriota bacterium]